MLSKLMILMTLLAFMFVPAAAHNDGHHTVSYDHFSFAYTEAFGLNVNISHYAGDPVEGAGPGFSEAAHTQFNIGYLPQSPDSFFDSAVGIRVYAMEDIVQYDFLQAQVDQLQALLDEQPDLAAYEVSMQSADAQNLPYVPVLTHGQIIRARAHYIETEDVTGIAYILQVNAAAEPFLSNSFWYTFQGISNDGEYYINATFKLTTGLFPLETGSDFDPAAFSENLESYYAESIAVLNAAAPEDFSPTLAEIDELIGTFSFG
jgi:hypothetical protein